MEIQDSFFKPAIVGILCIGTQLVFTYLTVDIHHLHKIQTTGEVSGHKSHIFYTKPYDFMVEADRREIFEHMFWFGFLQNGSKMDSLV
ncbi:hypothetical protein FSP39_018365 [Pinctada imbricata]|uniref:Uncharacterized protein n=1 Tax=Pinctada imbricata TaxID=66713 RepID=A0AA89BT70_PINIB|nr:hypothetical protein FSP39_018365 [Pinctada imbricata]